MTITLDGTSGITSPNETTGVLTATSINASGAITAASVTTTGATGSLNSINTFGFKNRIINGNMAIDQRNAGASVTIPLATTTYTIDRWGFQASQASKLTAQQNAGAITPPTGFNNYLGYTVGAAANVTLGASDYFTPYHRIEGFNFADMAWGTASAATITLSFWVRSSLTGTFSGSLQNGAGTRSYPFTYTISSANTWEQKTITIAGDTTGTWIGATNGIGVSIYFNLGTSSAFLGTANTWANAGTVGATGSVNLITTNSATFYITGVQLEKGSVATSFDQRAYSQELAMCQRYYESGNNYFCYGGGGIGAVTDVKVSVYYKVTKRISPSVLTALTTGAPVVVGGISANGLDSALIYYTTGNSNNFSASWTVSSEL